METTIQDATICHLTFLCNPLHLTLVNSFRLDRVHERAGRQVRLLPRRVVHGRVLSRVADAVPHRGTEPHRKPHRLHVPSVRKLQGELFLRLSAGLQLARTYRMKA